MGSPCLLFVFVFAFLRSVLVAQIPMSDVSEEEKSKDGSKPQCGLKRSAPSGRGSEEDDDENAEAVGSFEDVFGGYVRCSCLCSPSSWTSISLSLLM